MTKTHQILRLLAEFESRNVLFVEPDGSWPIVWERAKGVHVWDAQGKKYLDLSAAFGVAAAGHANPRVIRAGRRQMGQLLHAMGDVHPHALKARLARELSRITFERWSNSLKGGSQARATRRQIPRAGSAKTIFCNSGFEAVEAALKTALLATGKPGVIAFDGGYHGLGYGALNVAHRDFFRGPFKSQLGEFGRFVRYPLAGEGRMEEVETQIRDILSQEPIGAIIVEPIQGRGGIRIPPTGFLAMLRRICDERGALLILDEIFTGFGRAGKWFACEHERVAPDLICLGKALTGGFPLSACVGRRDIMDAAWPPSHGEAIHTSTFLGHPVGCAMALAQIAEMRVRRLPDRSAALGEFLLAKLKSIQPPRSSTRILVRGLGLMAGLELLQPDGAPATQSAMRAVKAMLKRGYIVLPEGQHGNVISFTPPLTITQRQLKEAVTVLEIIMLNL